jgi:DNA-binding MarR family transcriptional regulator
MSTNVSSAREEAYHLFGRLIARSDPGRLDELASLGLTITQLRVLFILRGEPDLSAGALAERLAVTPSTLTRIMDRLVRNDLIKRAPAEDDRRLVLHSLTGTGRRLVEQTERQFQARMDRVFSRLDDGQVDRIVEALRDLAEATEAVEAETQEAPVG